MNKSLSLLLLKNCNENGPENFEIDFFGYVGAYCKLLYSGTLTVCWQRFVILIDSV